MLLITIKAIAVLLATVSIIKSYIDYRKGRENLPMFLFWIVIWVSAATIIVYPMLIDQLMAYTQDSSITIGSLISFSFIFMLYIVYRIYAKAARIEYQQAELVRKLWLKRLGAKKLAKTK